MEERGENMKKDEKLLSLGYQGQIYYSTRQILSRFSNWNLGIGGFMLSIGGGRDLRLAPGACSRRARVTIGGGDGGKKRKEGEERCKRP